MILYAVVTKKENVLSRLTFLKACRLDVFLIKHHDKYRFTREKKSIETKDKKRTGPQSE